MTHTYLNKKAQTAVEYMLLFTVTAIIVFAAFKSLVPRAQQVSNQYYNKVAVGIMGRVPDTFVLDVPTVRMVTASQGNTNDLRVNCEHTESVVGGGCYFRRLQESPEDMHMHTESTTTTRGGNYYCHARDRDTLTAYALCYNYPANCHVEIGNTGEGQHINCPAGQVMSGGGCYVRNVGNGGTDDFHAHPLNGGYTCSSGGSGGSVGTAYTICCSNLNFTCRTIAVTNSPNDHHCRVTCGANEFVTGGGCYLRDVESSQTEDAHMHPETGPDGVTTKGGSWYCEQNNGDHGGCAAWAICCS